LGDPIEIQARTQAFRASTQKTGFCAMGSVKTNIGRLDMAAGAAGLIKTILSLKHNWQTVLGIERVGVDDNFPSFEHSRDRAQLKKEAIRRQQRARRRG
jgi:ascorbate-specific PTS system EIIC-type component UlaA